MSALPSPYVAVVLALAVYRWTRLVGWDEFPPVRRARERLLKVTRDRTMTQRHPEGDPPVRFGRPTLTAFLQCPYCLGFWIGVVTWWVWLAAPTAAVWVAAPFALNAVVGLVARNLDQ